MTLKSKQIRSSTGLWRWCHIWNNSLVYFLC